MKRVLLVVLLLIGFSFSPFAANASTVLPCPTESVAALIGTTCDIGQIQFTFTRFYSSVYQASVNRQPPPLSASQVTFTPGGTTLNPSFTMSGNLSLTSQPSPWLGTCQPPNCLQIGGNAQSYFELDYSASMIPIPPKDGRWPWAIMTFMTSFTPADLNSEFTYETSGSGVGDITYDNLVQGNGNGGAASFNLTELLDGTFSLVSYRPNPDIESDAFVTSFAGYSFGFEGLTGDVYGAYVSSVTSGFGVGTQAPEPESVSLCLFGFGLMGLAFRHRRSRLNS